MNHDMRLFPESFAEIRAGRKRREYRLYDEKRRKVKPGDTITFYNTDTGESVAVDVIALHVFDSFAACYERFWQEDFVPGYESVEQAVKDTYANWWPQEAEQRWGCVAIDIELAKQN